MKTTKLFFIAALALIFAACNNNNDELTQQPAEQPADNMITVTAKLAPKSGTTRAVTESEGNIVVDWAVNEKLKIIGEGGEETTANIDAVDASGVATISFDISNTAKDKDCTIIYPYDAAVTKTAGVYTADPITAQNGALNAGLDVRIGEGHITDGATPTLDVTMQPQAMFAIWKLTLANEAKGLYITADGVLIAGVTLGTANTEFTIAVPAVDTKTVAVVATNGSDCKSYSKAGVSLTAGKYYQSSPTMTAVSSSSSEAVYQITGSSSATIPAGKTVALSSVSMTSGIDYIKCLGDATIILIGDNTVNAFMQSYGAIQAASDASTTLTITGTGSLTATSGSGAGIGGGYLTNCGNIVIAGGNITATGTEGAAGIGSRGETTCGNITITGGTINATGGYGAAGIGSGDSGGCGNITITTGVTSVTAKKSEGYPAPNSIGAGSTNSGTSTCGTVTIGGMVYWDGSAYQNGGDTYLIQSPLVYPAP